MSSRFILKIFAQKQNTYPHCFASVLVTAVKTPSVSFRFSRFDDGTQNLTTVAASYRSITSSIADNTENVSSRRTGDYE